jgi:hypothetical protein
LSIEQSRKHGPFDLRYPPTRHKPAQASLWRLGEESADWEGFRARFFPGCRLHDLDALAAYESYRNDVDGAVHVARSDNAKRGKIEEPPAAAETERWGRWGRRHSGTPASTKGWATIAAVTTAE